MAFRILSAKSRAHINCGGKGQIVYEGLDGDDFTIEGCPLCFAQNASVKILNGDDAFPLYADYKDNGILPYSRGLHEHPARYVDAMRLLRRLDNQTEQRRIDEMKKNGK